MTKKQEDLYRKLGVESPTSLKLFREFRMIVTTNLEFSKWVNIFYDEAMTTAMIDRLIHHSHLLLFDRGSYRGKHSLMQL